MRAILCLLALAAPIRAADPTYWRDARPILRKHCTVCHSARTLDEIDVSGGLALDTYAAIVGQPKKPVVVPKHAENSPLLTRLREKDKARRMPLDAEALPAEAIATLTRWIETGAVEGAKIDDVAAPIAIRPPSSRPKLDVVLATKFSPPKTLAAKPFPNNSPLELVLPVGPLAPVTAVAYSPDGSLLAVGNYGRVVVWSLKDAAPAKTLTNVLGAVNDIRFSPDGATLAVAGGQPSARGDLRLYRANDWHLLATLGGHADVVASVAWSPDGSRLASASFDKTIRVWDATTRLAVWTSTAHSDFVHAVSWSPKGDWLATASKDRTVRVLDAATGKSRLTLSGMEQDVLAIAASPDGKTVVSSGYESQMHWWNAATGERTRKVTGHDIAVHEIAFGRDGKLLVSAGGDKTLRVWNGETGQAVRSIAVGSLVYAVALSGDGKQVAAGSFDGLVRLYEPTTGRPMSTLLSAAGEGDWLALTPEGFVSGGLWEGRARWRVAGQELAGDVLWKSLRRPSEVAKALRGEKVGEPGVRK